MRVKNADSVFYLGLMARMIAVDREYVVNKYKLHKLKDIEGMIPDLRFLYLHGCDDQSLPCMSRVKHRLWTLGLQSVLIFPLEHC